MADRADEAGASTRPVSDGWVGAVAVVSIAVVVLVGAALLIPGRPD